MKTIRISGAEMQKRIARFRALEPLPIQRSDIPLAARDVVYSRKLLSVIGLEDGQTPINAGAPILGAAGMTMTLALCPPGQGPGLHAHRSFPPGVCRAFRNIGEAEGILQVLITGGVHDMTDIDFSEDAKRRIEAVGSGLSKEFEKAGFSFTAGK